MPQRIGLFPAQRSALAVHGRELLLDAEPRAGATHLLRVMAVLRAAGRPRNRVVIAVKQQHAMREKFFEGPSGLWALMEGARAEGGVELTPGLIRLRNGSSIQVVPWDDAARRNPDTLLIDDADTLGFAAYSRLRERVLARPAAAGDETPRLVVVSKDAGQSWVREHWRALAAAGARAALPAAAIPQALRDAMPAPPATMLYREYMDLTRPGFVWHRHCEVVGEHLQLVVERQILRLLIQAPPRYGKSELVARGLPGYELRRRPDSWCGLASSTAKLATTLSKDARSRYRESGGEFMEDSKDASLWRTPQGGGMWAKGVGAAILGFGFNLGIIDDPFKSRIEACSPTIQDKVFDWWWGDFYTRRQLASAEPAAIVIMHQRLHEADLAGRILEREEHASAPQEWTILNLPAIKRRRQYAFPASCRVVEDERAEGEALCPALQSLTDLKQQESADAIIFSGVYQQDPVPSAGGGIFERHFWAPVGDGERIEQLRAEGCSLGEILADQQGVNEVAAFVREVRAWDFAATRAKAGQETKQAATCGTRAGCTSNANGKHGNPIVVFTDQVQEFVEEAAVFEFILKTARADGLGVEVVIPQDPGPAGKILAAAWQQQLEAEGFHVVTHVMGAAAGSKRARALPHAGAAKPPEGELLGRCQILRGAWNDAFAEQHHRFDGINGQMDRVDSSSDAFNELAVSGGLPPADIF